MLRIGYEYAGFAATTSTTKGGEDTFNPSSVEASGIHFVIQLTEVKEANQITVQDGGSTFTEESSNHPSEFDYDYSEEKVSKADTNREQLWTPADGNQNGFIGGLQRSFSTPEREQGFTWPDL